MIDVKVDFDGLFRALTNAGFDISILAEISENTIGSISMHIVEAEQEAECNECNGCACEAQEEMPNPFIMQHEQKRTEMARLGLSDLKAYEQFDVIQTAKKHIKEHKIEDEDEKVKVHHEMRDHYLAYQAYLENEK